MKNDVMISIHPKYCELIAHGYKTIEVRKNAPKLKPPFKCYIYQSTETRLTTAFKKGETTGYKDDDGNDILFDEFVPVRKCTLNQRKVIGEFVCDKIETIECSSEAHNRYSRAACLTQRDFIKYCNGQDLFGWHISDLVIYETPLPLDAFKYQCCGDCEDCKYSHYESRSRYYYDSPVLCCDNTMKRPPQSWCYCYKGDIALTKVAGGDDNV